MERNATPKRQKIARCMVRYNALNYSRPRTETGQPVTYSEKRRCRTVYEPRPLHDFHRTNSDPDLFRLASRENLATESEGEKGTTEEIFTTYTAIGSHEDIHNISPQMSVHEILTSFEEKQVVIPPVPKPRVLIPKPENENMPSKPVLKPKPVPRPPVKSTKSAEKENDKQCMKNEAPNQPDIKALIKQKPLASPVPRKPKTAPKPKPPSPKPEGEDRVNPRLKKQDSTTINIEYTVSGINKAENSKVSGINKAENSKGYSEGDDKKRSTGVKQKTTKTYSPDVELAYSVVDISETPSHPCSPTTVEGDTGEEKSEYDEVTNEYLKPVDVQNGGGEPVLTVTLDSTSVGTHKPTAGETSSPSKTPNNKEKRNNFKVKKHLSKSVEKKKPGAVEDRRVSLPDFHPKNVAICSDIDDQQARRVSDSYPHVYLTTDDAISPAVSDDEGWNSDEFESSSGGEEEEEEEEPIPKLPHLEGTKKKLYNIVTEILSTERAYVRRLHLLDQVFNKRFIEESKDPTVIPDKVVEEIFPYLSPIYKFHAFTLLPEIEQRIKEWESNDKIGDIFKRLGHYLLLYSEYVKNFDHATSTLNHWLKKSPRFATIVNELQKDPKSENLTLQHHMLEPVQRVPRYKLLLADYLKRLPDDSPDRKQSEDALKVISKAAENSNNSMKENQKFKKLLEIEDRIADGMRGESLVLASREFLKEGDLVKLAARSGNRMARTIILFNDLLLCGQQTATGKLKVKLMDLYHLNIVDNDPDLPELAFRVKSKQKVLDLLTGSEDEKTEWVEAIREAVLKQENRIGSRIQQSIAEAEADITINDNAFEIGQQAPPWVKDQFVSMCMLCASKFGIIYRKHHCRGCGRVVCGKCSNYNAKMAYEDNKMLRVCFSCAKKLSIISEKTQATAVVDRLNDSVRKRKSVPSDMHGEVFWKAPGKEFKKEWLFLSEFVLYGQKKRQDVKAQFTLPVLGYEVEMLPKVEDSEHQHTLKLHKQNKKELSYYIACDNQQLIESWYNHLECAVKFTKYDTGSSEATKE